MTPEPVPVVLSGFTFSTPSLSLNSPARCAHFTRKYRHEAEHKAGVSPLEGELRDLLMFT